MYYQLSGPQGRYYQLRAGSTLISWQNVMPRGLDAYESLLTISPAYRIQTKGALHTFIYLVVVLQ